MAQEPLPDRVASRLLQINRRSGGLRDGRFRDFPDLLRGDDLIVFNNTRVFPARLYGRRSGSKAQPLSSQNRAAQDFLKGRVEVLLTRQLSQDPNEWECLVRPGRKIGLGERLFFGNWAGGNRDQENWDKENWDKENSDKENWDKENNELQAEIVARGGFGERRIRFRPVADFLALVERLGHVPLPPYIDRPDRPGDRDRYQTVYAREPGSVAAPTAGLHFTPEILGRIRDRGIETTEITLHVGLGTFQPVRVDRVEDHRLHRESYAISAEAATKINRAVDAGRRVVAVGTTTVRTLEYAAGQAADRRVRPGSGEADIFIHPGYEFRVVGALLTNFHLPQSTLLMLVCAFGGKEAVMDAYRHAVEQKYRFYSYGDCMFVE
jgi:S-adenosylmethionine:tRNA ribosyltransferase-isomerase